MIDVTFLRRPGPRRRIAQLTVACAAAGALYGLVAPKWYRSDLTVVPVKAQSGGGMASLLGGEMGGLAAALAGGAGAAPDISRIAAVLQSVAVSDAVIEKCNLRERYGERHPEAAREALWKHCGVRVLPKPGLVQLSCEDKDPRFAQQMVAHFAEFGNEAFRRVSVSSATEEVRYLEKRIAELRRQADDAAARMQQFQETHQIVDLDTQARALVTSVAAVNAQRITKKMELDYARSFSAQDEASARQLESQLQVMDDALRDLEVPREGPAPGTKEAAAEKGATKGLFPAATRVPRLRAEFEKLYRDRKVAEATLVFSLDRLEGARANEARDVSTFQVLDPPTLATVKSRPRIGFSALVAAAVGVVAGLLIEAWRSRSAPAGGAPPEAPGAG
jgi:capsule polysaccharide export protein KpsE/RkpR